MTLPTIATTTKDDLKSTAATKLPLSDTNEFIHILNQFNAEWQQAMKDQPPTEQEELTMKDLFVGIAKSLGEQMCLPNDNPIPVDTVLTEPEDEDLNKERTYWREKSRDSFRRAVLSRSDMINHIRPFLTDANVTSSSPCVNGIFDDDDDDDDDTTVAASAKSSQTSATLVDSHDYLISQHMESEFNDSMGLIKGLLQELPDRVTAFDEIETILAKLEPA